MKRLRSIGRAVLFASALGLYVHGCADHREWTRADAWHHPATDRPRVESLKPVPWVEVRPEARAAAEQRLDRSVLIPLRSDEVAGYAGGPFDHPGLNIYLVRGVYLNRHTGGFYVRSDGRDLYVDHASLGRSPVPMKRQPLLVALPAAPRSVYVSCGMDE
jgi:hypothetical protein